MHLPDPPFLFATCELLFARKRDARVCDLDHPKNTNPCVKLLFLGLSLRQLCCRGNCYNGARHIRSFDAAETGRATYRGDHLYAFYQIPVKSRRLPLVMWHGARQFSKTWETTPDGREGFQNISSVDALQRISSTNPAAAMRGAARSEQRFRRPPTSSYGSTSSALAFGRNTSTASSSHAIQKLSISTCERRRRTPVFDINVISDAVSPLFKRIGPAILVTHSQSGGPGWLTRT